MEKTINKFDITTSDVIEKNGVFYLTVAQIAENLKTTKQNVRQILNRNKEEFEFWNGGINEFPPYLEIKTAGGVQSGFVLNEQQIYVLCMLMTKNKKARQFRKLIVGLLDGIKKGEYSLQVNAQVTANEKLLLEVATLREDLAVKDVDLICAKSNINNKKRARYQYFRQVKLTCNEASRALKISYNTATAIDKAMVLIGKARETVLKISDGTKLSKIEQMDLLQGYDSASVYKTLATA